MGVVLLVPGRTAYDDGPRDLLGRIPGIVHWRDWQAGVVAGMATIRAVVAADRPGLHVIITEHWTRDRYVHLALVEAGYRAQRLADIEPACTHIAESFERGRQRTLHLRIDHAFLPDSNVLKRERFDTMARPCLDAVTPAETVLVVHTSRLRTFQDGAAATVPEPPEEKGLLLNLSQRASPTKPEALVAVAEAMLDRMSRALCGVGGRKPTVLRRLGVPGAHGVGGDRKHPPHHLVSEGRLTRDRADRAGQPRHRAVREGSYVLV